MRDLFPFLWIIITIILFLLNLLALMQLLSLLITLPLLFISIYATLFSFTHKRTYRGMRS